jgi:hypothetical protein
MNVYEIVTEKVLESLNKGVIPCSRSAARVLVLLGPETMVFARWRGDEPAARAWTFPA